MQTYNISQLPAVIVFSSQGRLWTVTLNNVIQSDLILYVVVVNFFFKTRHGNIYWPHDHKSNETVHQC